MAVAASQETSRPLRVAFRPVWLALAAVTLVHVLGVSVPVSLRYGVFLLTVVAFGLPHGAVDHLCIPRVRGADTTARSLALVGVLYLLLGGAYAIVWVLSPVVGFVFFILLTWYHWGQGDLYPLRVSAESYPHGRVGTALTLAVRGGLPMLVPLVFFPDRYQEVATILVSLFESTDGAVLDPVFTPGARLAAGVGFGLLSLGSLAWGYWAGGDSRGLRIDAAETALLWAFFALVPPVLAVGLYFALWHSIRHILRLVALDAEGAPTGSLTTHLRQFGRDALPMSVGALAIFGLLYAVAPHSSGDLTGLAGLYLVLLAVLTLPHVVVVTWLDSTQGIWPGQ